MEEIITTKRLRIRTLMLSDLNDMTTINQDKKVMQYFPDLQNRCQTNVLDHHI